MRIKDVVTSNCPLQANTLVEMASFRAEDHGIPNIVIWVGKTDKSHGMRVKVSNTPNKWNKQDNFVIEIPSLDYDPKRVANWISGKTMNRILSWIKINQDLLFELDGDTIHSFEYLKSKMSKA